MSAKKGENMKKDLKEVLNNNFSHMDLRGWNFKGKNMYKKRNI